METPGTYKVARPDARELMVVPNVTFRTNALIFNRPIDLEVVKQLTEGLDKFKTAHPWFFSDMWREMALRGYEWVEHVPDSINLGTAQTWYKVGSKFLPDDRVYDKLLFSHYAATRSLPDVEAHKILEAANEGEWTEKAVREAVKLLLGNPPKRPKLKAIICPHCDNWIADVDDKPCPYCMFRNTLKSIRDSQESDMGVFCKWVMDLCNELLEEI